MMISIVTIHLDDFSGLKRTLDSLESRLDDPRVEWILVDGASRVHSEQDKRILADALSRCSRGASEPDDGIYDAMNKGTRMASGDYVLYLNAGDELHADFSLDALTAEIGGHRPAMIWGTCHERFPNGTLVRVKTRSPMLAWYGIPINHQNVLFKKDAIGNEPYDLQYRYHADYDLIGRLLTAGARVHRSELPLAIFQRGGISSEHFEQTMREEEGLRQRHFGVNRGVSKAITVLKKFNHRLGKVPALRRLMRRWV